MKMRFIVIIGLAAVASSVLFSGEPSKLTTEWVGCPMVSNDDKYMPSRGWLPTVEIGLRSDGVVVWRDRKSSR